MELHYILSNIINLYHVSVVYVSDHGLRTDFNENPCPIDLFPLVHEKSDSGDCYLSATDNFWYFGNIRFFGGYLRIGPIGTSVLSEQEKKRIFFLLAGKEEEYPKFSAFINVIPRMQIQEFAQLLCFLNYLLNHVKMEYYNLYVGREEDLHAQAKQSVTGDRVEHTSSGFEERMLSLVKQGKRDELKEFLLHTNYGNSGVAIANPLRQAKDYLISSVTLVSRTAIEAGLDKEEALTLSDNYIQLGELSGSLMDVYRITFQMVMDYTERIASFRFKSGFSKTTVQVIQYLEKHLTESPRLIELSSLSSLSLSQIRLRFKQETGISPHQFLLNLKINEAKRLLKESERTVSEISYYLDFSSQSHFQNLFRKAVGMTPLQYRSQG